MTGLAGLLRPENLLTDDSTLPDVMAGEITDTTPLRVKVPAIDGGRAAVRAFGTLPDAAAEGDPVRVMRDEFGALVVVAWEPA